MYGIKELIIPTTVQSIPEDVLEYCLDLTNITIPLNDSQIIVGNNIFNKYLFTVDNLLSESIKIIN